ncbi:MAG: 2-C-methyl-D-erythritol 4-phosphate cytidylyltransferase [Opitutales bacterium]|nr:2-C-methyl-D-erythritol 4-phosphate cytidylyltransferase [Opitutales bacterium]
MSDHTALLLAAGSGTRLAGELPDKTTALLAGKPVIRWSAEAFVASGYVNALLVTYRDDAQKESLADALTGLALPMRFVRGGKTRGASVLAGLRVLTGEGLVFIHDGARPCLRPESVRLLFETAIRGTPAALAHRVADTIKEAPNDERPQAQLLCDLNRARLWAMETPQVFPLPLIRAAYETAGGTAYTDDVAVANAAGHPVSLIEPPYPNPKLTHPRDLPLLAWLLQNQS